MEAVTPNPPTDFQRGTRRTRLLASLALSLAVSLAVLLNVFSSRIYWRGTIKEERLSPLTRRTLALLETVTGDVELIGLFAASDPLRDSVAAMLAEFKGAAEKIPGLRLTTQMVDPAANADEAVAIRRRHNAPLPSIIVRSRDTGSSKVIAADQLLEGASGPAGVVADAPSRGGATGLDRGRRFIADQRIALVICDVLRTEMPKVCFLTDSGAYSPLEYDSLDGYSSIASELRLARYEVGVADLSTNGIPDDVDVLVLAGPRARLSRRAIEHLSTYLAAGGRLLLMLDGGDAEKLDDSGLYALLGRWGVRAGQPLSRAETASCRAVRREGLAADSIVLALGRAGTLTLGSPARMFFPAEESLPAAADRPRAEALLSPSSQEANSGGGVVMSVERGASGSGVAATRMVVVGDARFASNAMMETGHDANRLFFLACVDWLSERNSSATAERSTPRVLHSEVTPGGWPWVVVAVVLVWPAAILLVARLFLIRRL